MQRNLWILKPCESVAWVIFYVLHSMSDSRGTLLTVSRPWQLPQKGRRCFRMATRCRSRTALVNVNLLALDNGKQPSVHVNCGCLVCLPFCSMTHLWSDKDMKSFSLRREGNSSTWVPPNSRWSVLCMKHWPEELWHPSLLWILWKKLICFFRTSWETCLWMTLWDICLMPASASFV